MLKITKKRRKKKEKCVYSEGYLKIWWGPI